jgi:hypothetical protein
MSFPHSELPQRVHADLVKEFYGKQIVGHVSRDSTAIEAREKPLKKAKPSVTPPGKRGRLKKGTEKPAPALTRLEMQSHPTMTLSKMLAELPKACDIGTKRNSQGFQVSWQGYKLHLDINDIGLPLSAILTSASTHDSQVAIPLMKMTQERVGTVFYELMDSAYDSPLIEAASRNLGRVPIIDVNPRRNPEKQAEKHDRALLKRMGLALSQDVRFHERTVAERANGRLKDECGADTLRVRGHAKAVCHLMFGVCVLAADVLLRLLI